MTRAFVCGVTFALLLAVSPAARGAAGVAGFQMVVNPLNPSSEITRAQLADVYLKKEKNWADGTPALPVDQSAISEIRASFSKGVLRQPTMGIQSYWNRQIFEGRGVPPPVRPSDATVLAFVEANRGGIGYVAEGLVLAPGRLKVLRIVD